MKNAYEICKCTCGTNMNRDFAADLPFASGGDYHRPIISDSLAISPEQIAEHKQLFPDVQVTPEGQPVFDSFKKHDDYLKATGFRKKRQRRRRVPTSVIGGKKNSKTKT
jgi:hypothetical protein